MKRVFADTSYWIARALPSDEWHERARSIAKTQRTSEITTTEEVLVEFLNALSKQKSLRIRAVELIKIIISDPRIRVIPQSHGSFLQGLHLYQDRPDKLYSLTDCISMETMRDLGIEEALTSDHHFAQEGFTILMKLS